MVRDTRKVHLAPRGTERRKAGRDPGSHQDLPLQVSRAPAAASEAGDGESWCLVDPSRDSSISGNIRKNEVDTGETLE